MTSWGRSKSRISICSFCSSTFQRRHKVACSTTTGILCFYNLVLVLSCRSCLSSFQCHSCAQVLHTQTPGLTFAQTPHWAIFHPLHLWFGFQIVLPVISFASKFNSFPPGLPFKTATLGRFFSLS